MPRNRRRADRCRVSLVDRRRAVVRPVPLVDRRRGLVPTCRRCRSSPGRCPAGPPLSIVAGAWCRRATAVVPIVAGPLSSRSPAVIVAGAWCRRATAVVPMSPGLLSSQSPAVDRRRVESNGRRAGAVDRRRARCRRATAVVPIVAAVESNGRRAGVAVVPACPPGADVPALPIVAGGESNGRRADRRRAAVQPVPRCRSSPGRVQRPSCRRGCRAGVPTWCRRAGLADRRRGESPTAVVPIVAGPRCRAHEKTVATLGRLRRFPPD